MKAFEHFGLTGKTALVTGGSAGLGYVMADALVGSGASVMIVGRREELLAEASRQIQIKWQTDRIRHQTCDLYDASAVDMLSRRALQEMNGFDIFIGNAGVVHAEPLEKLSDEAIHQTLQLNLVSNIALARALSPKMKERGWGRILFSSSIASNLAVAGRGNYIYSASKSGINGFMRALAADLGRFGITVNSIVLGLFRTSIVDEAERAVTESSGNSAASEMMRSFYEMSPMGRIGDPEELRGLVQLLASNAGSYINGACIPIDGGMSIMLRPLRVDTELP